MLRAVVAAEDFELLHHVDVRVDRGGAVAARVGGIGAVGHDVHRVAALPVGREIAESRLLTAIAVAVDADVLSAEGRLVAQTSACRRHAGNNLDEFRRAAADNRKVLQLFSGDGRGLLARVYGRQNIHHARYSDRLGRRADLHNQVREVAFVSRLEDDIGPFQRAKSVRLHAKRVDPRKHAGDGEVALFVGFGSRGDA